MGWAHAADGRGFTVIDALIARVLLPMGVLGTISRLDFRTQAQGPRALDVPSPMLVHV